MKLSGIVLSILTISALATMATYALPPAPPSGGHGVGHMAPPRGGHMAPVAPIHRMSPPPLRHRSHIGLNWNFGYGYNYGYNYMSGCYYTYDFYGMPRMVCTPANNFGIHVSI